GGPAPSARVSAAVRGGHSFRCRGGVWRHRAASLGPGCAADARRGGGQGLRGSNDPSTPFYAGPRTGGSKKLRGPGPTALLRLACGPGLRVRFGFMTSTSSGQPGGAGRHDGPPTDDVDRTSTKDRRMHTYRHEWLAALADLLTTAGSGPLTGRSAAASPRGG